MEFVRSLMGYDHLWAVRYPEKELEKLNQCRDFSRSNGIFDQDSFLDFIDEQSNGKQGNPISGRAPE